MNDVNNWQAKFVNCSYSNRLLQKLSLINETKKTEDKINLLAIKKAIYYAKKYHGSQQRQSGELFYSHALEVASMVADYCFKTDPLVSSILHDTIEDTELTKEMIHQIFNANVSDSVAALTRIKANTKISIKKSLKLLLAHPNRNQLLLIKYFDRVHNIKTIMAKPPQKILKIIQETLKNFINVESQLKVFFPDFSIKDNNIAKLCYQNLPSNLIESLNHNLAIEQFLAPKTTGRNHLLKVPFKFTDLSSAHNY